MLLGENPLGISVNNLLTISMEANPKGVSPFGLAVDSNRSRRGKPTGMSEINYLGHKLCPSLKTTEEGFPTKARRSANRLPLLGMDRYL